MAQITGQAKLKKLLKDAVVEVLEERRDLLRDALVEAVEDMGMIQGIKKGSRSGRISREEVFRILPNRQFLQLVARARQPKSLVQFFRESPLAGLELDFERDNDTGRKAER